MEWNLSEQMRFGDCGLRPGVLLFLDGAEDRPDRIQLSSGTIAAAGAATSSGSYEEEAMIPRASWRSLTQADREAVIAQSCPKNYGNAVSVTRISSELLEPFQSLRDAAAEYRSVEKLSRIIASENCRKATHEIIGYVQQNFQRVAIDDNWSELEGHITVKAPGLPTVSVHPDTGAFVGLHVDSWYNSPSLERRFQAPNRMCVNLGFEDRFFLFLNIPIGEMDTLVKGMDERPACSYPGATPVAREFMRSFPSYPVVRVRIAPGEAYIAPTENIAHDGSSSDMSAMDVTLSLLFRSMGDVSYVPNRSLMLPLKGLFG